MNERKPQANDRQVGGSHYKKGGEEHWDRAWRLKYDPFQYIITKWVERWRDKGGVEDLEKARHALDKYIEVIRAETAKPATTEPPPRHLHPYAVADSEQEELEVQISGVSLCVCNSCVVQGKKSWRCPLHGSITVGEES